MGIFSSAFLRVNFRKEGCNLNEKTQSIYVRVTRQEKIKIEQIAAKCGLSISEYLRKRALGFAPQTVQSSAFYDFSKSLGELLNQDLSEEFETKALMLFDRMQKQLLTLNKESITKIKQRLED